jgi:hypothetical protein
MEKQEFKSLGFIDLSSVKESGAAKIYKTASAAKAQATKRKNKEEKAERERFEMEQELRRKDREKEQAYLKRRIERLAKLLNNGLPRNRK